VDRTLLADVTDFVQGHRTHGELRADAGTSSANGYRLEVRCLCGVVFERWVTPDDAGLDLVLYARWR
jgi:hypothetical protein